MCYNMYSIICISITYNFENTSTVGPRVSNEFSSKMRQDETKSVNAPHRVAPLNSPSLANTTYPNDPFSRLYLHHKWQQNSFLPLKYKTQNIYTYIYTNITSLWESLPACTLDIFATTLPISTVFPFWQFAFRTRGPLSHII